VARRRNLNLALIQRVDHLLIVQRTTTTVTTATIPVATRREREMVWIGGV
jgi:hypothetical protein